MTLLREQVDLVPAFRSMGEAAFVAQARRQRDQLAEFLEDVPTLAAVGDDDTADAAERAVKAQLHHLTQLAGAWGDVLPARVRRGEGVKHTNMSGCC